MSLSEVILSAIILIFITAVVFISVAKELTGYKKIIEWVLITTGFVSFYSLWSSVYYFFIKGLIEKGIIPILTLIILFIIPITGLLAYISINKIKIITKNFTT